MRKVLILLIGALIAVSCVKTSDFEDYQSQQDIITSAQADRLNDLQNQIDALVIALADSTEALEVAISDNAENITANADAINVANEAIASNLELIGQVSTTLSSEVTGLYAAVETAELELVELIGNKIAELEESTSANLASEVVILRGEIAAAQLAAEAYADANDQVGGYDDTALAASIATVSEDLGILETQVDLNTAAINKLIADVLANTNAVAALTAQSASYDDATESINLHLC